MDLTSNVDLNKPPPQHDKTSYVGRFAPSPSGKLHFGSLVAALASYLDARAHKGQWLVRMEELDPPREEAGAADSILASLEAHHLFWDKDILYQSQRLDAYQAALDELGSHYPCNCTRHRIMQLGGRYDSHCRRSPPPIEATCATRLKVDQLPLSEQVIAEEFDDLFLGHQQFPLSAVGDMIVKRKDGLFAYQLAVAVDDRHQNITHVIRGHDLIDSSNRQRYILLLMNHVSQNIKELPLYGHVPLALGSDGDKLSKQTQAPALDNSKAANNLVIALQFLNHAPPPELRDSDNCASILEWASLKWQRNKLPTQSMLAPPLTDE